jgi:hypothetical protein
VFNPGSAEFQIRDPSTEIVRHVNDELVELNWTDIRRNARFFYLSRGTPLAMLEVTRPTGKSKQPAHRASE